MSTAGSHRRRRRGRALRRLTLVTAASASLLGAVAPPAQADGCQYVLGFKGLHNLIPDRVGDCLADEHHNPANGDGLQETTGGLLVWRKHDNWTAFTDGYHTWINGPFGLQERLNTQRFSWEAGALAGGPLRMSRDHGWVRLAGSRATIGLTDYAQGQLGDVVFVDLPKVGTTLQQGQAFGEVESVKAASDLYAPVSGTVVAINDQLATHPELINSDAAGQGWLIEIAVADPPQVDRLLSESQYAALVAGLP
jgi:glycine cleavage system H protein